MPFKIKNIKPIYNFILNNKKNLNIKITKIITNS